MLKPKYAIVLAALVAACVCETVAVAQERTMGTAEQQAACTPDAFRLCGSYIPDPTKVEACLRQNETDLTAACRSVFEQGGGQSGQSAPKSTAESGAGKGAYAMSKVARPRPWPREWVDEMWR